MRERPVVDVLVAEPPDAVMQRFRDGLTLPDCPVEGNVGRDELSLHVGEGRHPFSPYISLEVRPHEDGTTRVRGRFGPAPNLWTLFVFIYSAEMAIWTASAVYGTVLLTIDEDPLQAAVVWLGMTVALGLSCAVDLTGRAYGRPQMRIIRRFVARALEQPLDEPAEVGVPQVAVS